MADDALNAHTLTLEFGRLLTDTEWHDLILRVQRLPYIQRLRADLVHCPHPVPAPRRPLGVPRETSERW